jgi:hypothetical protein
MDTKTVAANASGKVDSVLVQDGDVVKQGQLLASLDADALNTQIKSLKEQIIAQDATIASMRSMPATKTLTAPVDSRVKAIYAKVDDDANVSMSANGALMVLSTDDSMKVSFVPNKDVEVVAGSTVKFVIGNKSVNGYITIVPDSTSDKAEAVVADDNYAIGKSVIVKNAKGTELGSGTLEVNRPLFITAYSGSVDHLYVSTNDVIKKGHKLVRLTGYI